MFETIKSQVNDRFQSLLAHKLFVVDIEKDVLFQAYLAALPEEERQYHNCNCCKSFLNHYGKVVAIVDGEVKTIWEFEAEGIYKNVPAILHDLVKTSPIVSVFVSKEANLGTDSNVQLKDGNTIRWTHFHTKLPKHMLLARAVSIDTHLGDVNTRRQTFLRALTELTQEATESVLELIAQNSLYRGAEFKSLLEAFLKHQKAVSGKPASFTELYAWANSDRTSGIRNSAIGSLLVDISEGRDLDAAVTSYEQKVAPQNYRRPTAIVTKGMLEKAEKELTDAGLMHSLDRRHANRFDIPVSEVLHINRPVPGAASVFQSLKDEIKVNPKTFSKVEEVPVDKFITDVLPTASELEVLVENRHANNFMNLTVPAYPDAPTLFNWDNGVAWVYKDGVADSIKERVKAAGGSVTGDLRVSLSWSNYDDLDLHVIEPNRFEIYYGSKVSRDTGGNLDVDMNAGMGTTRTPVENIVYPSKSRMLEGDYKVVVNNFRKRETIDVGFTVQIEFAGEIFNLHSPVSPADGGNIGAAIIAYSHKHGIKFTPGTGMTISASSLDPTPQEIYGLTTYQFHKVSMVLPSPNHWSGKQVGNKHTFFILEGARTDDSIRGFFNEFLKPELSDHRKVFELLGNKVKVAPEGEQLAGLGFSSTQRSDVLVRVTGATTRVIKVVF